MPDAYAPAQRPLRILLIHTRYRLPGGEDAVFEAERAMLLRHGHQVFTYERTNEELAHGAKKLLAPFTALYSVSAARAVRRIIRKEHIDIVHVHNTLLAASPSVFWACFQTGVPVVQTLHNFRLFCPNGMLLRDGRICEDCVDGGLWCAVKNRCYRQSRAQSAVCAAVYQLHRFLGTYRRVSLIALTDFDKDLLLSLNKRQPVFDPAKLYQKPNAVELPPPPGGVTAWAARKRRYVYAARLERAKGLATVVEAWRLLADRLGDETPPLLVAGQGPLDGWAREECRGLPVKFLGQVDHDALLALLAESRGLVAASLWYETFGLAVAEANAMGTPVLAAAHGNLGDAVREGENGFSFAPGDAAALADAVLRLEAAGPGLSPAAIRVAETARYGEEENYRRLMDVYADILKKRKGRDAG